MKFIVTKAQALMLLATGFSKNNPSASIMCHEYGDDTDWNEVTTEDLDSLQGDEYINFEIWG